MELTRSIYCNEKHMRTAWRPMVYVGVRDTSVKWWINETDAESKRSHVNYERYKPDALRLSKNTLDQLNHELESLVGKWMD